MCTEKHTLQGAVDMVQPVKCLPCRHRDLKFGFLAPTQEPGMAVHICNLSTGQALETGCQSLKTISQSASLNG